MINWRAQAVEFLTECLMFVAKFENKLTRATGRRESVSLGWWTSFRSLYFFSNFSKNEDLIS